jgi:hypothetical protein
LFVVGRYCPQLVEQFKSAPLQPLDKRDGGEMIDPVWESRSGHAVAAARYGVMTRPAASKEPEPWIEDPRERMIRELLAARDEQNEQRGGIDRSSHMG